MTNEKSTLPTVTNIHPMMYQALKEFNKLSIDAENYVSTILRIMTSPYVHHDEKSLAQIVRNYIEQFPYINEESKHIRMPMLREALRVKDTDRWKKICGISYTQVWSQKFIL
jgi:hypothetical protein